jgi:hypothetical protein
MRTATTSVVFGLRALVGCGVLALSAAWAQNVSDHVPRLADGHPDFSGTWENGSGIDFVQPRKEGKSVCVFGCGGAEPPAQASGAAPQPPSRPKYRPEFAARVADLSKRQVSEDPVLHCLAPGVPRIGPPDKIVQRPGEAVFLYDDVSGNFFRIVPTDGRQHRKDAEPSFLGDAVGRWEGDTLVVESVNFNTETWLTDDGAFHTKDLRVVERLRRTGADTLEWAATVYDPAVLSAPWQLTPRVERATNIDLVEAPPCIERSLSHMVDDTHHTNPR